MSAGTSPGSGARRGAPALTFRQAALGRHILLYLILGGYAALVLVPLLIVLAASLDPAGLPRLLPADLTGAHYRRILANPGAATDDDPVRSPGDALRP